MSRQNSRQRHHHTTKSRNFCRFLQKMLLNIFFFVRYYVDILIDKLFGFYYDSKQRQVPKITDDILLQSATSLAKKIRSKELKSEEIVQAFIDRIKEVNPLINSMVDNRFEDALNEARQIDKDIASGTILDCDFQQKPFLGVPFTSKESSACKGMSFTFGIVKRKNKKASFDADVIENVKKSGAILLGVTNLPQLNLWQETKNPIYGITNNPYNTTRNVGGSCGGESSILSAGGSPMGIGTDIGGSCRIPAFMCGVYGHKTTSHVVSTKGLTFKTGKETITMGTCGPMTRYAQDIGPLLKVMAGENANKLKLDHPVNIKKLKVYYVNDVKDVFVSPFRDYMKKTMASVVEHFTEICDDKPEEIEIKGAKNTTKLWRYWMSQESDANFKNDVNNREGEANALIEILKFFTFGSDFSGSTIMNFVNGYFPKISDKWARDETKKLSDEILSKLDENSILLYPSSPWVASYHYTAYLRPWNFNLFAIWNVLKFPVTQVPTGLNNEGLPMGIQVVGAPYQDRLCIAAAKEIEAAFGGYVPPGAM